MSDVTSHVTHNAGTPAIVSKHSRPPVLTKHNVDIGLSSILFLPDRPWLTQTQVGITVTGKTNTERALADWNLSQSSQTGGDRGTLSIIERGGGGYSQ